MPKPQDAFIIRNGETRIQEVVLHPNPQVIPTFLVDSMSSELCGLDFKKLETKHMTCVEFCGCKHGLV